MIEGSVALPPSTGTRRPVPRWAVGVAHAVPLLVLPSSLWRIGLAVGLPLGYTEQGLRDLVGTTMWGPLYLAALSLLTEVAALLTLGLVRPWGEVVPRWIPLLGGRMIPRPAVTVPAWLGVAVLALLWTPFLFWWTLPHVDMTAAGRLLVGFVYLPLVAWAPLLAAVTLSYQRRRSIP
ncbi:hypothetical protein [Nonomuraea sp. SYSU D8015]|uniref:hypothetical protein n=1 Tax=Nonomuraea sp. SYSU D8015 TaxID=2593644 RepID=UPI001CB74596|nr:hypothetical protein [Nonomuraea sp. SYSU D8015]